MARSYTRKKKHNCPDCFFCQWCAETRCSSCKGWVVKRKKRRKTKKKD